MDQEIQQHLIAYLGKLEELAKQGADLAAEQIPLVLQEYIVYTRVSSTVYCLVGLAAIFIGFRAAKVALQPDNWSSRHEIPPALPSLIVAFVTLLFLGPPLIGSNIDDSMKSWFAPRVLLIEKLNELRK